MYTKKFYVHEIAAINFSKIHVLKNAKKTCKPTTAVYITIEIGNLDWNESHEKKTKHIHASAADLLHIRIGNFDWYQCRVAKTKREK